MKEKINQNFNQGLKEVTGELSENLYFRLLLAGVHDIDILRAAFGEPEKVSYSDIWDDGNMLMAELDYGNHVSLIRCVRNSWGFVKFLGWENIKE